MLKVDLALGRWVSRNAYEGGYKEGMGESIGLIYVILGLLDVETNMKGYRDGRRKMLQENPELENDPGIQREREIGLWW